MLVTRLRLRNFRGYASAEVALGAGLTVIHGRNGTGKTNLLEALYFGCTGRSCRTSNERELVRFDAGTARVEVDLSDADGHAHRLAVGFTPGDAKRLEADGAPVERFVDVQTRPLVCVFLSDRLALVKGAPALRRSHVDQVVAASWPTRAATRRAYGQALAQRNALLAGIRAGRASRASLPAWDAELGRYGIALRDDRAAILDLLAPRFTAIADALGLGEGAELRYRPRSRATTPEGLATELGERVESDLERGFTGHGPHRDDVAFLRDGRELRAYGSQGEQRLALLALLIAERETLAATRDAVPLILLDDVMSELDGDRRGLLAQMLRGKGQSVITTTDLSHVPGADEPEVTRVAVAAGAVLQGAVAARPAPAMIAGVDLRPSSRSGGRS